MKNLIIHKDYFKTKHFLTFNKVKERKLFLRDMATLRIAISILETSIVGYECEEDIQLLHKNKQRKELKIATKYLNVLKKETLLIHGMLSQKDINAIIAISEKIFTHLVKIEKKLKLIQFNKKISLPHIVFFLLNERFDRENIFPKLKMFVKTWGVKRIIKIFEQNNIKHNDYEKIFAKELNSIIKKL